jgi:hypothetical protein
MPNAPFAHGEIGLTAPTDEGRTSACLWMVPHQGQFRWRGHRARA